VIEVPADLAGVVAFEHNLLLNRNRESGILIVIAMPAH
jgi:hypothetical protein